MTQTAYTVHVILDPQYGMKIRSLPPTEPIWIAESLANSPAARAIWQELPSLGHLEGVTLFKVDPGAPAETSLLGLVGVLELHHGQVSHDPPVSVLHVIGAQPSQPVRNELQAYGFSLFETTLDGFIVRRTQHSA